MGFAESGQPFSYIFQEVMCLQCLFFQRILMDFRHFERKFELFGDGTDKFLNFDHISAQLINQLSILLQSPLLVSQLFLLLPMTSAGLIFLVAEEPLLHCRLLQI